MIVLIDNIDIEQTYDIVCLDYSGAFSIASERENQRTWADKSGVDKNLTNVKYDAREFVMQFYVKAATESLAYDKVQQLVSYMKGKGCFVLSLRDTSRSIRKAFLCQRSGVIAPTISVRNTGCLYVFRLGLQEVNPNALQFYNTKTFDILDSKIKTSFNYDKGQVAVLYWGDGVIEQVTNSGTYSRDNFTEIGMLDIIIDIDSDAATIGVLTAQFTSDKPFLGITPQDVQFTDTSTGTILLWSWDFGDSTGSSEQNPLHTYTEPGTYTVTLQVFNSAKGWSTEQKVNYITVRKARLLINDSGDAFTTDTAGEYYLTKN